MFSAGNRSARTASSPAPFPPSPRISTSSVCPHCPFSPSGVVDDLNRLSSDSRQLPRPVVESPVSASAPTSPTPARKTTPPLEDNVGALSFSPPSETRALPGERSLRCGRVSPRVRGCASARAPRCVQEGGRLHLRGLPPLPSPQLQERIGSLLTEEKRDVAVQPRPLSIAGSEVVRRGQRKSV